MSLQQTKGQVDRLSFEVALTFTLDISFRTWNMTDIHMYYIYICTEPYNQWDEWTETDKHHRGAPNCTVLIAIYNLGYWAPVRIWLPTILNWNCTLTVLTVSLENRIHGLWSSNSEQTMAPAGLFNMTRKHERLSNKNWRSTRWTLFQKRCSHPSNGRIGGTWI